MFMCLLLFEKKCENRLYCFELADELQAKNVYGQKVNQKKHLKVNSKKKLYNFAFLFKLTYKKLFNLESKRQPTWKIKFSGYFESCGRI